MNVEQILKRLAEIDYELNGDNTGMGSKDVSENSTTATLKSERSALLDMLERMAKADEIPHVPGTWNIGDGFHLTYLEIDSYGQKRPTDVTGTLLCKLVADAGLDEIDLEAEVVSVSIKTQIGLAILHKRSTEFRDILTNTGYVSFKLERATLPENKKNAQQVS